jgi:hypothetical protein
MSRHYAAGLWPRHELTSAQERAFRENREYILPVRLDDTPIPGVNSTTAFVDLRRESLADVAEMLRKKLGRPPGCEPGPGTTG